MQAIFKACGDVKPELASHVAELLGLDPARGNIQLAGQQAAQAAAQQGTTSPSAPFGGRASAQVCWPPPLLLSATRPCPSTTASFS